MVVADTGPINYLLLIGHIEILPALFDRLILPSMVRDELARPRAPLLVRDWVANLPDWAEVHHAPDISADVTLTRLDPGEASAIALAVELHAELLLIDDREGAMVALRKGFRVAGTLGALSMASRSGLLNLADAFDRLKRTNFHYRQELMDQFLREEFGSER